LKIGIKLFIVVTFIFISNYKIFAQNNDPEIKIYTGVFVEYTTLILLAHDLKLYTNLNYFKNETVILSVQPGFEFIYSFNYYRNNPYYDVNLLATSQFFPNYGISVEPFIGINYRLMANAGSGDKSSFNLKYGATLQLNIAYNFKIIAKIMNMPTDNTDDVQIFLGVGIAFKLF
jgi:hypothetical protein